MTKNSKIFIPALAVFALALVVIVLALRGTGVPDDAVATVDGDPVSQAAFDNYMKLAFGSQAAAGGGAVVIPDPPDYKKCVANKRKTAAKTAKSEDLKKQCSTEYTGAKNQIMAALINQEWYSREADEKNIKIGKKELTDRFETVKSQAFPTAQKYKDFLDKSGQTEVQLVELIRGQIIQEKVRQKAVPSNTPVTDKELLAYYNKNKKQYSQPVTRNLKVIFNPSKSKAQAAKNELESGKTIDLVVKKYSKDPASKANKGSYEKVPKGQFEAALDKAIWGAGTGDYVGPIKTQFGYYVFTVIQENPADQKTFKEVKEQIKQAVTADKQQKAFTSFQNNFLKKWKSKTKCGEDHKVELCKNGPKPKKAPAQPGQPAPQQQPPPQ